MSTVQSNYMSDAAIMAWVTQQQDKLYGELHGAMSFEEQRSEMASDVSNLKGLVQKAGESAGGLPELGKALDAFEAKYGDVPEFNAVKDVVDDIRKTAACNIRKADGMTYEEAGKTALNEPFPDPPDGFVPPTEITDPNTPFGLAKGDVDRWTKELGEKVDASNQNQQLGMIHIGEIKSTIDQGSNLASQLVKSGNDTTSSIINNF